MPAAISTMPPSFGLAFSIIGVSSLSRSRPHCAAVAATEKPVHAKRYPPANHAAGANGSVGLGWQMRNGAHGMIIFKDGAMPGYAAYMVFVPAQEIGVVVLSNQAQCAVQRIAGQIMGELSGTTEQDLPPSESNE